MNKIILLFLMVVTCSSIATQVTITTPIQNGDFSVNDLYLPSVLNLSTSSVMGVLEGRLVSDQGVEVVVLTSQEFEIAAGNTVSGFSIPWISPVFGFSQAATLLRTTDRLPPGEYVTCFIFTVTNGISQPTESCQEFTYTGFIDFELTLPYDQEEINTLQPILAWESYFSLGNTSGSYAITIKAVNDGQPFLEAMAVNPPLYTANNIVSNQLFYGGAGQNLEYGKTYVWQVVAISPVGETLATSSIWTFTPVDPLTEGGGGVFIVDNSFPLIASHSKAVNYLNRGTKLKFAYDNWEGKSMLDYRLCSFGPTAQSLDFLPEIPLMRGLNTIELDIAEIPTLLFDEEYCLIIYDSRGTYTMRLTLKQE